MLAIILICIILCIIFRIQIFKRREEKIIKAVIPAYNKYVLGKLCDNKKLGIFTMISSIFCYLSLFLAFSIEFYIIGKYTEFIDKTGKVYVNVPDYIANTAVGLKYIFVISLIILFILFSLLMRQFSIYQGASSWWVVAWGLTPIIAYYYFAKKYKYFYIPNKGILEIETTTKQSNIKIKKNKKKNKKK